MIYWARHAVPLVVVDDVDIDWSNISPSEAERQEIKVPRRALRLHHRLFPDDLQDVLVTAAVERLESQGIQHLLGLFGHGARVTIEHDLPITWQFVQATLEREYRDIGRAASHAELRAELRSKVDQERSCLEQFRHFVCWQFRLRQLLVLGHEFADHLTAPVENPARLIA